MSVYLNVIQIIISITLIVIILIQVKGDTGGLMGGGIGVARTRRGLERTLFNITIVLAAIFILVSFFSAIISAQG